MRLNTLVDRAMNRDSLPLTKENRTTVCSVVKQHITGTQNKEAQHTCRGKAMVQLRAAQIDRCLYRAFAVF